MGYQIICADALGVTPLLDEEKKAHESQVRPQLLAAAATA